MSLRIEGVITGVRWATSGWRIERIKSDPDIPTAKCRVHSFTSAFAWFVATTSAQCLLELRVRPCLALQRSAKPAIPHNHNFDSLPSWSMKAYTFGIRSAIVISTRPTHIPPPLRPSPDVQQRETTSSIGTTSHFEVLNPV